MTTITTRSGKGSPLTNDEVDANFTGLNSDKVETSGDSMTGDLSFGDNNKVVLGAGSDLKLYHTGSHSYIDESGTGNLYIGSNNGGGVYIQGSGETLASFVDDGAVTLNFDNAAKVATSSTGIDITGTATMDGLTVNSGSTNTVATFQSTDTTVVIPLIDSVGSTQIRSIDGEFAIRTGGDGGSSANTVEAMRIDSSGNLQLSGSTDNIIRSGSDSSRVRIFGGSTESVANGAALTLQGVNHSGGNYVDLASASGGYINFRNGTSNAMRLDSSGNVGIGTSSPNAPLEVAGAATTSTDIAHFSNSNGVQKAVIGIDGQGDGQITLIDAGNNTDVLFTAGGVSYINTGGNFGIGTDDPKALTHIYTESAINTADTLLKLTNVANTARYVGFQAQRDNASGQGLNVLITKTDASVVNALTIDTSANVGIGTSNPSSQDASANNLVISDTAGNGGLTINTPTNAIGAIHFSDGTSGPDRYRGIISYGHSDNSMRFHTDTARAMTIDSSGNVLVGKTSAAISGAGTAILSSGTHNVTVDGDTTLQLNRLSSPGPIATFFADGGTVGSIGTLNSALTIGTGDTGIQFNADNNAVMPHNITTGANVDASIDIGYSSGGTNRRFKDLYLSGSVITGGNTTNNFGSIDFKSDSVRARIIGGYASGGGGYLKFHTDSTGGSDLERMRIDSSGHVIAPYGVTLGTAVGTYAAANTLDDYEEGTFSPVLADATTGGNASSTGGVASYTKIGQQVFLTIQFYNINTTGLTSGNDIFIQSLPFTAKALSGAAYYTGTMYSSVLSFTRTENCYPLINDNESYLRLGFNRDGAGFDGQQVNGIASGSTDMTFNISYMTA